MKDTPHKELVQDALSITPRVIRKLAVNPRSPKSYRNLLDSLADLQKAACQNMPRHGNAVRFWETVWRDTNRIREQWRRIEEVARRAGEDVVKRLKPELDEQRRKLYEWARRFIEDHAPLSPSTGHFELGLHGDWSHMRSHHQRLEGLYQAVKRTGALPELAEGVPPPGNDPVFGLVYGGGWSVSTYSILREAANHDGLNGLVAFDGPAGELYQPCGPHTVRVAPAGLYRRSDEKYELANFRQPAVVHFACPHGWTGPRPHQIGLPVLRSDLTLEVTDEKTTTGRALRWYANRTNAELPLIPESSVEAVPLPADLEDAYSAAEEALSSLQADGISEVVIKPSRGWEARRVRTFDLETSRDKALEHTVQMALECGAVIQKLVPVAGPDHFNWRVFVARNPAGKAVSVGRFARIGKGDSTEMIGDREMLQRCGREDEADKFLASLDAVAVRAFRAVSAFTSQLHPRFPHKPLGGGSYAIPYFLGVDLVGDARIMEVNGNEVAGLWTHDRLYPHQRGRTSRTVLKSAKQAARAYQEALQSG